MKALLLANLLIGGYNFGTVWAHELDIFRTWTRVGERFHEVQRAHWRKLPYWVFAPVALGLITAVVMVWFHPEGSPAWGIWGSLGSQILSLVLTAAFWGRWQAKLANDARGADSPYLRKILRTHWVRTGLVTANAVILVLWAIAAFG
ncbi:hypothetical protein [Sinomonas sp. ASV322]|uniref:hypothetical protein n=1 Tax=Sinomonas sp. ASV322 TaxID=3041920 RepID=UPI0027DDF15F|nr:hypothetical protein [Sinomonas sp. ASV322]MDQ4503999.1 hypothetical protein [Sinomonas sp. ASV322]